MSKLKMVSSFFMIVSLSIFFHLNIFADEFMSELMSEFITEKEGECNKSSDIEKRFKNYYEKAADKGNVNAQYYIGKLYYKGKGIEKDYKKAFEYLKKAAEQGHVDAQYYLGKCYYDGKGVEKDYEKAFELGIATGSASAFEYWLAEKEDVVKLLEKEPELYGL